MSNPNSAAIRVLIVEDDARFADVFAGLLRSHTAFAKPQVAPSLAEARRVLAKHAFDVIAIDLKLPDGSGLELIGESAARTVVVSVFGDEDAVVTAIQAGIDGYVVKDDSRLVDALIDIYRGLTPLSAAVAGHVLRRIKPSRAPPVEALLSPRETEILTLLANGQTYQEAAEFLNLSYYTVADHVKSIYRKLKVGSGAAAVLAGVRAGLIRVDEP
ncbi:MAG: response regulator transcription factor [Pseudomonadota bacterium]